MRIISRRDNKTKWRPLEFFLFQYDIYDLYNIDIDYQDCITSYHIQNILFLNNLVSFTLMSILNRSHEKTCCDSAMAMTSLRFLHI